MKKKGGASTICLVLSVFLIFASCGRSSVKFRLADGTKVTVKYTSSGGFRRSPVFEKKDSWINMKFNGITWYSLTAVDGEYAEKLREQPLLGESSDLEVYETPGMSAAHYSYLMPLKGTDNAFILFVTDTAPGPGGDYGNDFGNSISYWVGKKETVPDTGGLVSYEEEPYVRVDGQWN